MKIQSYKELIVWQRSVELVKEVYRLTGLFPREEQFGIVSQMRRAVVSIPSNIAEGYGRRSHKEYLQFYAISYGSALELETQLIISKQLRFTGKDNFIESEHLLEETIKMLYVMVHHERRENKQRLGRSV